MIVSIFLSCYPLETRRQLLCTPHALAKRPPSSPTSSPSFIARATIDGFKTLIATNIFKSHLAPFFQPIPDVKEGNLAVTNSTAFQAPPIRRNLQSPPSSSRLSAPLRPTSKSQPHSDFIVAICLSMSPWRQGVFLTPDCFTICIALEVAI